MKFKGLYFVVVADACGFSCGLEEAFSRDGLSWLELFRLVLFDMKRF